jgi:hypothetical protein
MQQQTNSETLCIQAIGSRRTFRRKLGFVAALALSVFGVSALALTTSGGDLTIVRNVEGTVIARIGAHIVQNTLTNLVLQGQNEEAFEEAFEIGDELFGSPFNGADGSGANVGTGSRFTRIPRADLTGANQWATHVPSRATGPNAQACTDCHNQGADDGSGAASGNVHRDGNHTARFNQMVQRNTPSVMGLGGLQKLAEEITVDLQRIRDQGRTFLSCGTVRAGASTTNNLVSKGVNFGTITITHDNNLATCRETLNPPATGAALAVSTDLVVRPFQWKGSVAFIRDFVRGAAHNELGMQASELLGSPTVDPASVDGDGDGVRNELFVGDITALTLYQAAQARPTTRQELASLGLSPALTAAENAAIADGSAVFDRTGCGNCHVRRLLVSNVIFSEPSSIAAYRDAGDRFPNGRTYASSNLDPAHPITFNLLEDSIENADVLTANGQKLGAFQSDSQGRAIVDLFGDLRRHDMGSGLAEEIDEVGTGRSVFLTENLWGVGSSAPYLHDGRAATLTEAILEHGGEGRAARDAFVASSTTAQKNLVAFLNNMVLFKTEED